MSAKEKECVKGHEHIVYYGRKCPLCVVRDRLARVVGEAMDISEEVFDGGDFDEPKAPTTARKNVPNNLIVLPIRTNSSPSPKGAA